MLTNHKMKRILSKIPQKVQVDPCVNLIEKRLSAHGEDYYCFRSCIHKGGNSGKIKIWKKKYESRTRAT